MALHIIAPHPSRLDRLLDFGALGAANMRAGPQWGSMGVRLLPADPCAYSARSREAGSRIGCE